MAIGNRTITGAALGAAIPNSLSEVAKTMSWISPEIEQRKAEAMEARRREIELNGIGANCRDDYIEAAGDYMSGGISATQQRQSIGMPKAKYSPMQKLMMRLNLDAGETIGFDYIVAVPNPKAGNVIVFIIKEGQPLQLEDDAALFPTDSLIGRLNTLR